MAYTVLARRYRSQSFDEVVGQEVIARTLQNAIDQKRVAHAYLFVGQRGVGKTSTARIFAKALTGGTPEVDAAIMSGQDTDVIEIDAASNSKVDEIRELIANCIYRPMRGHYKVYIIDEVHMLSGPAFNALLKTLEEPPEHVKFILCTTETHKVPATIQSRCQRFDFRNISHTEIARHLGKICQDEGIAAEADLLAAVARLGNGSMRDALSLLDRLMAACEPGGTLTAALLERLLGLPPREGVTRLIEAIAQGDAAAALVCLDQLLSGGISYEQLGDAIADRFRDLMILTVCGPETDLVPGVGESREESLRLAHRFDASGLIHLIALVESAQRMVRMSSTPRALLDALIVRMAMSEHLADLAPLIEGKPIASPARASLAAPRGEPEKKA